LVQVGLVAIGGALGSLARWGVGMAFVRLFGTAFPWGTFFINMSGSLFLGWFSTLVRERLIGDDSWLHANNLTLFIGVGFTGAYTTFSTYEYEAQLRLEQGETLKGSIYLLGSMVLGLAAVQLGVILGRSK
jgi:CrcB protein